MNGLRELFDDLVAEPAPSTVMSADEVYDAGRRRRRARRSIGTAAVAVAAVLLAGLLVRLPLIAPGGADDAADVSWAMAGDPAHLYLVRSDCRQPTCQEGLFVSSDRGANWQRQSTIGRTFPVEVLGPRILLRYLGPSTPAPGSETTPNVTISFDGGATWEPVRVGTDPIEVVPAGGALVCASSLFVSTNAIPCELHAVDPQTRLVRRLVHQPPLAGVVLSTSPPDAGLWVSGYDAASLKPAVAVSHDAGRSWTTRDFTDLPKVPVEPEGWVGQRYLPDVVSADGRIAYAAFTRGDWPDPLYGKGSTGPGPLDPLGGERVMRTVDGGLTWHETDPGRTIPASSVGVARGLSYVTRDGGHALVYYGTIRSGLVILLSADGSRYAPTSLPGLPEDGCTRLFNGGLYVAYNADGVYLSDDGITWSAVHLPPL